MPSHRLVVIGQVLRPFGVRGEMKIRPFTVMPDAFLNSSVLYLGETPHTVVHIRLHKGSVLVRLEGIDTPERVDDFRNILVSTREENLPPKEDDEYYWFELIGMQVTTVDGMDLGRITRITPTGANDVLHVEGDLGEVLLPMIEDVVLDVDVEKAAMKVRLLEGLLPPPRDSRD
jgi:16S rRNA processing protein RimM